MKNAFIVFPAESDGKGTDDEVFVVCFPIEFHLSCSIL